MKNFLSQIPMIYIIFALIIVIILCLWPRPYDSSDNPETQQRSGMRIHVDHETGCEYLDVGSSLTPRLDSDGKQICRKSK